MSLKEDQFNFVYRIVFGPQFLDQIAEGCREVLPQLADEFPGCRLRYMMCEMDSFTTDGIIVIDNKPRKGKAVILTVQVVLVPEERGNENFN